MTYGDDDSVILSLGNTLINLLKSTAAVELIEPAVGSRDTATRLQPTITVVDVDSSCARLQERGVTLLNGPMDRP